MECEGQCFELSAVLAGTYETKQASLDWAPLTYEIVHQEENPVFIGRDWFFKIIEQELMKPTRSSIAIIGPAGCGKTAIFEQLVAMSCHGDGQGAIIQNQGTVSQFRFICVWYLLLASCKLYPRTTCCADESVRRYSSWTE